MFALVLSLTVWALVGNLPTGFAGKTVWDWMDVLGVPIVAVVIAGLFALAAQRANQRTSVEREVNLERAREATLRTYLDRMTDLMVDQNLQQSPKDSAVRAVAHAQTFAALRGLDEVRKGILVQFLHESRLIRADTTVIPLSLADLRGCILSSADLVSSNLSGVNLSDSDLSGTDLRGAKLQDAVLHNADLRMANLRGADVTDEQILQASSLLGAIMPDGSEMTADRWERLQSGVL